ncbi:hypothetical protein NMA510612_0665 [Neisseria meningitidis]|uniref:Uncharacterized protein n=1 Tax=Neisseria meningitidis TaxID=487 RepID=X5EPS7_NEIME|nr:hypothetical protein NMA510612_0665 [Neisseria meningitidis]
MKMPSETVLRFQTAFCHLESRCCHTQAVHKEQPYHAPHIDCHCRGYTSSYLFFLKVIK